LQIIIAHAYKTVDTDTALPYISAVARNKALKIAIYNSDVEQGEIAALARMHYTRLSQIINGRVIPNKSEKLRLAGVLQRPVEELFPSTEPAVTP
jgi:hypothetical protein